MRGRISNTDVCPLGLIVFQSDNKQLIFFLVVIRREFYLESYWETICLLPPSLLCFSLYRILTLRLFPFKKTAKRFFGRFSNNFFFLVSGTNLKICSSEQSCCSRELEDRLALQIEPQYENLLRRHNKHLNYLLQSTAHAVERKFSSNPLSRI